MNMLARAIAFTSVWCRDQTDIAGKPYILHPLRMMMRLRTDDEELMCIAVLHDSIEDGHATFAHLEEMRFSPRVIRALKFLTRQDGQSYESYIDNMRHNMDACRVKMEDLRDNSDITRLKGIRPKDIERVEKYHKAFLVVKSCLGNAGIV